MLSELLRLTGLIGLIIFCVFQSYAYLGHERYLSIRIFMIMRAVSEVYHGDWGYYVYTAIYWVITFT